MLNWLNAREATAVGTALADHFVLQTAAESSGARRKQTGPGSQRQLLQSFLQKFLQKVDRDTKPLELNVFKRAKLANSFKWRLLDKGVEREVVDELTQALLRRLTGSPGSPTTAHNAPAAPHRLRSGDISGLLARGNECMARAAYTEATDHYRELLELDPRHAVARNNLGAALVKLGRLKEAEEQFRRALGIKATYPDPHGNLGAVLQWTGRIAESETALRRALKLKPTYSDAQANLGTTLILLGRLPDAKGIYEKVLRITPGNTHALAGLAQIAAQEGRLAEAGALFSRALEVDPQAPLAWAGLAGLRKMTRADEAWLKGAEKAATGLAPVDEASLRYAIGKYYDDVADFKRAFASYQRANELQRTLAEPYDREARTRFVDDMIRIYTPEALARSYPGSSDSARPVFVVGMMRSGTSLVEQIIASHPGAKGAGELNFWTDVAHKHGAAIGRELLGEPLRTKLAAGYLRVLAQHSADASRVVDKATLNSDFLGIIHTVFPNARMIYLRRDPVDTCLSCYFQQFSPALNFTMDLSDLAHYYREHQRLVAHWHSALPAGTVLDVPYEELIADQERWTRKIIEFLGLEWDDRCLEFHKTERTVLTASYWQVRQTIYKSSVARWRNYREFVSPLLSLREHGS